MSPFVFNTTPEPVEPDESLVALTDTTEGKTLEATVSAVLVSVGSAAGRDVAA